ncbi:tautomerase family protein [Erythrobacter sp. NE805]|uniref:tautomerase family protein n=1 Tax=Erythrobacter sp. NE805 TaxID=3389875 RepID=UPI00396B2547
MTIITVTTPEGRLDQSQRARLAETLTDAVLVPEIGQELPAARIGFQVHFREIAPSHMAIAGRLIADVEPQPDVMTIDVLVMDGDWPRRVRAEVIERVLGALTDACGVAAPSPTWWVAFRVVEEGSWGSRGGVLSVLDLLDTGAFTPEKAARIRAHIAATAEEQ